MSRFGNITKISEKKPIATKLILISWLLIIDYLERMSYSLPKFLII